MNELPSDPGPDTSARDGDEPAWALGYEAALPWLTCATQPPRDDGARLAAPTAE